MIALRHYQDKKLGVFGLAKAGIATVSALLHGGAEVYAWDDKEESRRHFNRQFGEGRAKLQHFKDWPWRELEALVLSPGVPLTHPAPHAVVEKAQRHGTPIIGDIELLLEAQPHAWKIGVTGTNGKSTTTALISHLLKSAGKKVEMGGNIGVPALSLEPLGGDGIYVLELSSYQLDLLRKTHLDCAILLNVTPDHINRHGSMNGYVTAKSHIFDRQGKQDVRIVGIDDDYVRSVYAALKTGNEARMIAVSLIHSLKEGVYVDREGLLHDLIEPERQAILNLDDIAALPGRHNWQNIAFAYAACRLRGLAARDIEKGLHSFPGLRHRLQQVATIYGVRFINDSKATNADAASHALAPFPHIYWIAGGQPKEGGIASLCFNNVAHAFLIGEAQASFATTLEDRVPYTLCGTLERAFAQASDMAFAERKQGAVVLLSPACASFDQWKSFEERGDAFCDMAEALLKKIIGGVKAGDG